MSWYIYPVYFVAGALLSNTIPHLAQGTAGYSFHSPFGKSSENGESSPVVNVLWGFSNLVVGCALLIGVGNFELGLNLGTLAASAGFLANSLLVAWHFGEIRNN